MHWDGAAFCRRWALPMYRRLAGQADAELSVGNAVPTTLQLSHLRPLNIAMMNTFHRFRKCKIGHDLRGPQSRQAAPGRIRVTS